VFNGELFCNVSQTIEKILKNLGHSLMENSDRATPPSPLLLCLEGHGLIRGVEESLFYTPGLMVMMGDDDDH
jgi:hypothetical protein